MAIFRLIPGTSTDSNKVSSGHRNNEGVTASGKRYRHVYVPQFNPYAFTGSWEFEGMVIFRET